MRIYKDHTNRNEQFEKLVVKTQEEMKQYVIGRLGNFGRVRQGDGYVYKKGTFPVLLVAHMDTVHEKEISTLVYVNGTLSSPQGIGGDDRCGIYMIFKILKEFDCHVVFLEDEEIGCVGAKKFIKTTVCQNLKNAGLKYIIELDRKNKNHAVTYDCDNKEFDKFITQEYFIKEYGTCSDISHIAPELGIAAVNFSCGYYQEHNISEWVNLQEMETIIVEVKKVLERTKELEEPFKYIKGATTYAYGYAYNYDYGYNSRGYGGWYDDDDYYSSYHSGSYRNYSRTQYNQYKKKYVFSYKLFSNIIEKTIFAYTYADAMYDFFAEHRSLRFENLISVVEK